MRTLVIFGHIVEVWFDRRLRMWVAREVDVDGNQIDNADYHADRDTLLLLTGARLKRRPAEAK